MATLLRDFVADYIEGNEVHPAAPQEQEAAVRAAYAYTAEGQAEAWARELLKP